MDLKKPTLLINKQKCLANIGNMVTKARKNQVDFRPHFKTHQSNEIAGWFKDAGVDKITVSSVSMAQQFAEAGWKDITIAFPVNLLEIDSINELAASINLNLIVDNVSSIRFLNERLIQSTGLFIEVDAGYKRSGIPAANVREIRNILDLADGSKIRVIGFLSHFGNTYEARTQEEIEKIYKASVQNLLELKARFAPSHPDLKISIGDTPSCSIVENFQDIDEIRPGNFVYYDVMQYAIGSCSLEQISVAVACPVVSKRPERNEVIVYGGAVHLSKEFILDDKGNKIFGLPVFLDHHQWIKPLEHGFVSSLSQEHGLVKLEQKDFDAINIGDTLGVLPVHSCLTVDLLKSDYLIV